MQPEPIRIMALALWAAAIAFSSPSAQGEVRVRTVAWNGWTGAVELVNAETRLVVVPAIGRIMHYSFADGENVLWTDPALYGATTPTNGPARDAAGNPAWVNFGGDKVWANQQDEFASINGYAWPPDPWFDGARQDSRLLPDGVVLTSPVSDFNGARCVREIRLAATGTRVTIEQTIEKVRTGRRPELEPVRYTVWNVTQIRPPEQILFPLRADSVFTNGFRIYEGDPQATANFRAEDGVGLFRPDATGVSQKAGADGTPWLAAIVGDTVIAEFFRREEGRPYPDGGAGAKIYTCNDYTELELLSPLLPLKPGERLCHTIAWELHRLPPDAPTPDARRAAALVWLRLAGTP